MNFMSEGQQDKKRHWNKISADSINLFSTFFNLSPPSHSQYSQKGYFAESAHLALFSYQDELLMCHSAASQMYKVRQHSAHRQKNALRRTNVLIADVISPSSVLTKKSNFKLEFGLTCVKTLWKHKLTLTCHNKCAYARVKSWPLLKKIVLYFLVVVIQFFFFIIFKLSFPCLSVAGCLSCMPSHLMSLTFSSPVN